VLILFGDISDKGLFKGDLGTVSYCWTRRDDQGLCRFSQTIHWEQGFEVLWNFRVMKVKCKGRELVLIIAELT
jgi:hypothetical protein